MLHTLSAVDKAKNLYRLAVPLAAAVPTMPYMINAHPGGLQQGVLDTKRFVADWAALSEAADYRKGRYAMPQFASDVQCAKKNVLNASKAKLSPTASNVMMLVHGSPHAIVADIYNVEVAKGVATFSLRWIKAPKDTPDFGCHAKQDMQKAHYHHRPVAGCELEIAEDIALPGAALRDVSRGATLFIKVSPPYVTTGIDDVCSVPSIPPGCTCCTGDVPPTYTGGCECCTPCGDDCVSCTNCDCPCPCDGDPPPCLAPTCSYNCDGPFICAPGTCATPPNCA